MQGMIEPEQQILVDRVRDLMDRHGLSRRAACKQSGIAESTFRGWEKNDFRPDGDVSDDGFEEIPVIQRDYSGENAHYLYPFGDAHIGSEAHDEGKWQEWIAHFKSRKDTSIIGTGDFLNSALKTSVSEAYDETKTVGKAKRQLRSDLRPIASRIDLLLPGNHEARIYRAVGDCPIEDVADALEAPYARSAALIAYTVGQVEYTVYVRHGKGGGAVGARATRLQKQSQTVFADVYVSGHTHSQLAFPEEIFVYDSEQQKVVRRRRYFVSAGSFVRYEHYAAESGFAPLKLGAPRIRLDGERFDIHVSI